MASNDLGVGGVRELADTTLQSIMNANAKLSITESVSKGFDTVV